MMPRVNEHSDTTDLLASHEILNAFHRRFDMAAADLLQYDLTDASQREAVTSAVQTCLGIREAWIPQVSPKTIRTQQGDGFSVHHLATTSWPNVHASALLYVPDNLNAPAPCVLICCGHGTHGKLNPNYQRMARLLARRGAIVLCPDNIGQGERVQMGHRDVISPFAAGLSLQGLIVMETLAWLRWAKQRPDVDKNQLAAIGNSGGGVLTLMLIPFAKELSAIASTGYPSTFNFVARKEKSHCHCNLLPGILKHIEMADIYGCFAPKPLLLLQGANDHLFPEDLFCVNGRRTKKHYATANAADQLEYESMPGEHSWDVPRMQRITTFLMKHLSLHNATDPPEEQILAPEDTCYTPWPSDAANVDDLVQHLTGCTIPSTHQLWDVFPYANDMTIPRISVTPRGETRKVLAQFQAFLEGYPSKTQPTAKKT